MYHKIQSFFHKKIILFFGFLWGLLEATIFFIVPDVLLSFLGLFQYQNAKKLLGYTLLGALIGGTIMYTLAYQSIITPHDLTSIPMTYENQVQKASSELEEGHQYFIIAGFKGMPYKIYATTYGSQHIPYLLFIGLSILARLPRFIIGFYLGKILGKLSQASIKKSPKITLLIFALLWCAGYYLFYEIIILNY